MKTFKNEQEIKEHFLLLKNFYMGFYSYLTIVAATILIWMMAGAGYFWPIWIIVFWGVSLFFRASKLEVIDGAYYRLIYSVRDRLPFLKPGWEDQKYNELKKSSLKGSATSTEKKAAPKKTTAAKTSVKKTASKKTSIKKPAAKKAPAKKAAPKK